MARRPVEWVNTPVLAEALQRYRLGLLPLSMRRWVETVLELPPGPSKVSERLL
ncbi:hypothetical protein [Cyanobium sp. Morenito 9A2]|uniref:hypothetical protein n=1 Tax=Cyanobium sp. Morenito 9A2 TaxID=2823718 RepID=UPI0020CEA112|nr:hypothetical protein [Cyanobium sp. Morenito 9A2]MCP9849717.1 hypothetical protein [Cyanobium sp. Morenito 9A2]